MTAITGDETFTRFRRKLEDAVTVAINSGRVVAPSEMGRPDTCCPFACITGGTYPPPGAIRYRMPELTLPNMAPSAFTDGFDGYELVYEHSDVRPYYELGRLYRARFP